jgi:hypothetical protein
VCVLRHELLHCGGRPGVDYREDRVVESAAAHEAHGPLPLDGVADIAEAQNVSELPVHLKYRGYLGVGRQGGEPAQQSLAGRNKPRAGSSSVLAAIPLLPTGKDASRERLLLRVGREVVLADPLLGDKDRIAHRGGGRGHQPSLAGDTTSSSGRTVR